MKSRSFGRLLPPIPYTPTPVPVPAAHDRAPLDGVEVIEDLDQWEAERLWAKSTEQAEIMQRIREGKRG